MVVVVVVIAVVSDVVSVTMEDVSVVIAVVSDVGNVTVEDVSIVIVVVSDVGSVTAEDVSVVVVVVARVVVVLAVVGSVTVDAVVVAIFVVVLTGVDSVTLDAVVEHDVAVTIIASTLVAGFAGATIKNFNSRERVIAEIAKMIKEMEMIQQRGRRLGRSLFSVSLSTYTRFLYILCFKRTLNLIKK